MSLKRNLISPFHVAILVFVVSLLVGMPDIVTNTIGGIKVINGYTISGVWNGFNNHQIVVECHNAREQREDLSITLKDPSNAEIGTENISIAPHATSHILLNKFPINNNYGTFDIAGSGSNSSSLSCHTITYRMDANGEVQYATSMSVGESIKGRSGGVYNSMSPDSGSPVLNWLSVLKSSAGNFSANVKVRNQEGIELPERNFRIENLMPGQRMDIALGHPSGQVVGTYEIIPDDPTTEYGAFLSRYSEVSPGEYNFSMVLLSSKGYSDSGIVPASTMGPALNWGEIANLSANATNVLIEIFTRDGQLIHSEEKSISAFSQHHVFLNQYIGELNVGYFRVRALNNSDASLVVQSVYYGHQTDDPNRILWAYNSSARGGNFINTASYPVNTYLSAPNWLKVFSEDSSSPIKLILELRDSVGNLVPLAEKSSLSFKGSSDFPVHELVGPDFVGNLKISSEDKLHNFQGQLVRVFTVGAKATKRDMAARSMKELSGRRNGSTLVGTILALSTSIHKDEENNDMPEANPSPNPTENNHEQNDDMPGQNSSPTPTDNNREGPTPTADESPKSPQKICSDLKLEHCGYFSNTEGTPQKNCCYDPATHYCLPTNRDQDPTGCLKISDCIDGLQHNCDGYCCPKSQACGDKEKKECISGCKTGESACPTEQLCCSSDEICVQATNAPLKNYSCVKKREEKNRCSDDEIYCGPEGGQAKPEDPIPGFCCPKNTTCNINIDGTYSRCCPIGTSPVFNPDTGKAVCEGSVLCVEFPNPNYTCPTGTSCCSEDPSGCCRPPLNAVPHPSVVGTGMP